MMNANLEHAKKCLGSVDEALKNAEEAPFISGDVAEFAVNQLAYARTCALIAIAERLDRMLELWQERPVGIVTAPDGKEREWTL